MKPDKLCGHCWLEYNDVRCRCDALTDSKLDEIFEYASAYGYGVMITTPDGASRVIKPEDMIKPEKDAQQQPEV